MSIKFFVVAFLVFSLFSNIVQASFFDDLFGNDKTCSSECILKSDPDGKKYNTGWCLTDKDAGPRYGCFAGETCYYKGEAISSYGEYDCESDEYCVCFHTKYCDGCENNCNYAGCFEPMKCELSSCTAESIGNNKIKISANVKNCDGFRISPYGSTDLTYPESTAIKYVSGNYEHEISTTYICKKNGNAIFRFQLRNENTGQSTSIVECSEYCDIEEEEEKCTPHSYKKCYENDIYWFDSCDNKEGKYEECGSVGCDIDSSVCNPDNECRYPNICKTGDCSDYDNCGLINEKICPQGQSCCSGICVPKDEPEDESGPYCKWQNNAFICVKTGGDSRYPCTEIGETYECVKYSCTYKKGAFYYRNQGCPKDMKEADLPYYCAIPPGDDLDYMMCCVSIYSAKINCEGNSCSAEDVINGLWIITNREGNPLTVPIVQSIDTNNLDISFNVKNDGKILVRIISFEPEVKLVKKIINVRKEFNYF